ncbi:aspartyl/asparaginyl beta-hydroxylase domain-containing protein [Aestuariibacter halophilus]|uniref:Aspartyl/asparaginyl beta-hydroxylase domain-containing protein n=1 Tax=Fluctibacter halophilus TaxID=226011 RepID=A0ABS8G6L7_9ALTE|nr:aspartyl/asparaginyl beta-hydroxylase domain-containing protein [Aestuariibacter halophilus]MCC2616053.1 aspartyl/asparaginyl beta-hydroxylase domain-containing protein [Aestuariibacter halophilus]
MTTSVSPQVVQLLQQGHYQAARTAISEEYQQQTRSVAVCLSLAVACRGCGDTDAALKALDDALALSPHELTVLILKGDIYYDCDQPRLAMQCYRSALAVSPKPGDLPTDLRAAIQRVSERYQRIAAAMVRHIDASIDTATNTLPRFQQALRLLRGEAEIYHSKPRAFYYPGLPHRQFYPTDHFAWADELMASTPLIHTELQGLVDDDGFEPYMQKHQQGPTGHVHSLLDSNRWQALFLVKDGQPVSPYAECCPHTLRALAKVPLAEVPGRDPMVLFSRLVGGGHIPPHHGFFNTRLICHLPLTVPGGCRLRVGNETRQWQPGRLLVFDDSIEHEAWNDSHEQRDILIFDIWHPALHEHERHAISQLYQAIDSFDG